MPESNQHTIHALVVAAGIGSRFGGHTPKQYADLDGRCVLAHTLSALNDIAEISGLTVTLADNDRWYAEQVAPLFPQVNRVLGGSSRAESVCRGLDAIAKKYPDTDWVLIHDGARPCIAPQVIHRLLEAGLSCEDGAILAMPVRDTLKRAGSMVMAEDRIAETVDRNQFWAAQTPQLFPFKALHHHLRAQLAAGQQPTDDASVMEAVGGRPKLVEGSLWNIKITWPEDLGLAQAWLLRQKQESE